MTYWQQPMLPFAANTASHSAWHGAFPVWIEVLMGGTPCSESMHFFMKIKRSPQSAVVAHGRAATTESSRYAACAARKPWPNPRRIARLGVLGAAGNVTELKEAKVSRVSRGKARVDVA